MRYGILVISLAITACAGGVGVVEERVERVNVPVQVPCGDPGDIPPPVVPLNQRISREEWAGMQPSQRAGAAGVNAIDRLNRETLLDAIGRSCTGANNPPGE